MRVDIIKYEDTDNGHKVTTLIDNTYVFEFHNGDYSPCELTGGYSRNLIPLEVEGLEDSKGKRMCLSVSPLLVLGSDPYTGFVATLQDLIKEGLCKKATGQERVKHQDVGDYSWRFSESALIEYKSC